MDLAARDKRGTRGRLCIVPVVFLYYSCIIPVVFGGISPFTWASPPAAPGRIVLDGPDLATIQKQAASAHALRGSSRSAQGFGATAGVGLVRMKRTPATRPPPSVTPEIRLEASRRKFTSGMNHSVVVNRCWPAGSSLISP